MQVANGFILGSVFFSSLLGSIHCLGMCGPIVTVLAHKNSRLLYYHLGRLISYLFLGLIAGFVGKKFFAQIPHSWTALLTPIAIGLSFMIMGLFLVANRPFHLNFPAAFSKILALPLKSQNKTLSSFTVGLFSIALPCGWLYGYALGATSTNDPLLSMAIMFSFWLGTLPSLNLTPWLVNRVLGPLKKRYPLLGGSILIIMGSILILTAIYRVVL